MEESQGFKPDLGNPAVRDYRGASGNVTLVEMCSHLATERAGMGTLHLTVGAPELYPNRYRLSGADIKPPQAAAFKRRGRERWGQSVEKISRCR